MTSKLRGYGVGENGTPPRDGLVRAMAPLTDPLALTREDEPSGGMPVMETTFAVFDLWTEINSFFEGHFMERIAPGAFKKTMRENAKRVKVTFNHGHDPTLGDKVLGPIRSMSERTDIDPPGAWAEVPLFDTSYNRDLIPGLEAGVYGASFRFRVLKEEFDEEPDESEDNPKGIPERTIKELQLYEFGPVTFPAYVEATAGLRSLTDEFIAGRMVESPDQLRSLIEDALITSESRNGSAFFPGTIDDVQTSDRALADDELVPAERDAHTNPVADDATPPEDPERQDDALAEEPSQDTPPSGAEPSHSDDASRQDDAATQSQETSMRTVEEMASRCTEIGARLRAIDEEHQGEVFSQELQAEWDALIDERDDLQRRIQSQKERRAQIAEFDADERRTEREAPSRTNRRRSGASRDNLPDDIYDLYEYRNRVGSMDELRALLVEGARRSVEQATFPHEAADREGTQAHIERLLKNIDDPEALARHILSTGSELYSRAFDKVLRGQALNPEEQRALSMTGSAGGFAVPYVLDPTIIPTSNGVVNPLRQISRVESITGNEWRGISSQGVTAGYGAEASEAADNAPVLVQPTLSVEKAYCFIPYSIEIGQDWVGMQAEMAKLIQDGKDEVEATKFVHGLGSASDEPEGLLVGATAVVTTTAATTLAVGDLYKLEEAVPPRFRPNSRIVGAKAQYNRVRQLDTTGGSSLWARIGEGTPPRLLDYPAHELSSMPTGLTSGASILTQGDFSNFLIADRIGLTIEILPHLLGSNRRPTGQRGLYAYWRNGTKVLAWQAFRTLKVT